MSTRGDDGKTLTIGDVYVIHPRATAVNGDEALDAGTADNFAVKLVPGDDHFFFLALANKPVTDYVNAPTTLWSLINIEQPDVDKWLELEASAQSDATGGTSS